MTDFYSNQGRVGGVKEEMIGFSAWLIQAGVFLIASTFRYSGEKGGTLMEAMFARPPVSWRPEFFDQPWLPFLMVSLIYLACYFVVLRQIKNTTWPDFTRIATLCGVAVFSLSNFATSVYVSIFISIIICALASSFIEENSNSASSIALSAGILLVTSVIAAFMQVQRWPSIIEILLLIASAVCGFFSTWSPAFSQKNSRLLLPGWFAFLIAMAWGLTGPGIPSIRLLVMFELSAAFLISRYIGLNLLAQSSSASSA